MILKRASIILVAIILTIMFPTVARAQENRNDSGNYSEHSNAIIMPFAEKVVVKYRVSNKKTQYRRWNQTRNYWVDPYWITL